MKQARNFLLLFLGVVACYSVQLRAAASGASPLIELPIKLPEPETDHMRLTTADGLVRELTLVPELQRHLTNYLQQNGNPIASVVMLHVPTGEVLAMVQGLNPMEWSGKSHSALYEGFPAASLFKTVIAAAALEVANLDPYQEQQLYGGCHDVSAKGNWMGNGQELGDYQMISLLKAFALSCNGFFAKIAVQNLGLGPIVEFARRLGWGHAIPADFKVNPSPFNPPDVGTSGTQSVGRFAAGYGTNVGISAVHAAWINYLISNNGAVKPIKLFKESKFDVFSKQVMKDTTAMKLREIMNMTVMKGTATGAFRHKKYRNIASSVAGKTGTLIGPAPQGTTTWFAGIMSQGDIPEIALASVVVNRDHWVIKGPNLAAEAFYAWDEYKKRGKPAPQVLHSLYVPENKSLSR